MPDSALSDAQLDKVLAMLQARRPEYRPCWQVYDRVKDGVTYGVAETEFAAIKLGFDAAEEWRKGLGTTIANATYSACGEPAPALRRVLVATVEGLDFIVSEQCLGQRGDAS